MNTGPLFPMDRSDINKYHIFVLFSQHVICLGGRLNPPSRCWCRLWVVIKETQKFLTALLGRAGGPSWLGQAELLALKRPLSAETLLLSVNATFTNTVLAVPWRCCGVERIRAGLWGRFVFCQLLKFRFCWHRQRKCVSSTSKLTRPPMLSYSWPKRSIPGALTANVFQRNKEEV